ncbi:hypothetical protein Tco_1267647 [Tanacetum coccineum]
MMTLKFVDTHNMVVFLSKPAEYEGFEQIVDFLNAHPIKHALTVNPTIYASCIEQFWATIKAKTINGEVHLQTLMDGKKIIITKSTVRRDLQLEDAEGVDCLPNATIFEQLALIGPKKKDTQVPQSSVPSDNVIDEVVYKELDDSLVRAATTASILEAEQDSETMGDTIAQTRSENVSKLSNDPLLARGNTLRSGEDSMKLQELMALCTTLQIRVLDLETTKTTQGNEIAILKRRVKKLERRNRSKTHKLKRLYKMFDVDSLNDEEVFAEQEVAAKDFVVDEVTLAQALAVLKSIKPKIKGNVIEDTSVPVSAAIATTKVSTATTTTATIPTPRKGIVIIDLGTSTTTRTISSHPSQIKVQDKGKGIMVESEKPMKKKDQISFDEEIALKLQAEIDEEERIARAEEEKIDEANIAWDEIKAKVDADYQLAERLQAEEQEQFTIKQKATLFKELLEQRSKHFAAKTAEGKRNKPPTKTQQKKTMIIYLKNMEGWKHKDLKDKDFDSIK